MSSYTRANPGNYVSFTDKVGKEHTGVCLLLRSDSMLVGVQNPERPYVTIQVAGEARAKSVPNNALYAVPYESVISASVAA